MPSSEIDELLSGPLVTWFISCLEDPDSLTNYEDLVDGVLLHSVFLQIDPEPVHDGVIPSGGNISIRTKNLELIVGNMKQFYEEELGHVILTLPNYTSLGKEPELYIGDMKLMLLLLLGCAVQCPNKETFITRIKELAVDTQLAIVDCIKQVTDYQDIVITQDSMDSVNMGVLFTQIKKLVQERDLYREKWKGAAINEIPERNDSSVSVEIEEISKAQQSNSISKSEREDSHHYAVELADWKSKVRKQRQELEEKTEALLECKEELEHNRTVVTKLKQENQELIHEARTAKSYRDELDAVIEKAERADRLEMEVARYREKLTDIEFYKTRIEELREDNRVLMETREMLEEQLSSSRRRADKVLELESEIIKYKQLLNDVALERAADKEKYQELCDENSELHRLTKAAANEAALSESISDSEEAVTADNRLSEQLTNNAQTRALKLELENRRLITLIDSLKENSFHESSSRVLELEKEKKKLSLKVDSLNDNCERLSQQNADLELVCKQALEENKKLQNSLKNQRVSSDKQQQEFQAEHAKSIELEKSYETAVKEKQRIQSLLESAQRRADDLERSLELANQKLEELKSVRNDAHDAKSRCSDLESKLAVLEKEKEIAQRDIHKYRETIEEKDVALDKATNTIEVLERRVIQLEQEVGNSIAQISRLQEIERSSKELDSRAAIDRETLETLQSNLVAEKLNTQQLHTALEKFGLNVGTLLSLPPEDIVERISQVPEVVDCVKKSIASETQCNCSQASTESTNSISNEDSRKNNSSLETVELLKKEQESLHLKLVDLQAASENLLSDNARLQVSVTTLQSQSSSLATQHTALQLANSQLVAEKEELLKERIAQQRAHTQLIHDQVTLQSLHEQLNTEYENLLREREALKINSRDVKNETRVLRETIEMLETKTKTLQTERETLTNNAKSLNNLRGEHSKLKEDFRKLYTTLEKVKGDYRNLQEDYRKNKVECNRLSLKLTEMQGQLSSKDERCSTLELQISKLNQRCEMLLQMYSGLDNDRRSLMDHISLLFNQYHELLTHSLEDKEQYHMEEKMFTDKVNHLYRQKEKLEEKIMEHYRKLENCSTKKKSFGASFVRRVKKAGSELLSKNRRSWAEDVKPVEGKTYESESGGNDSDASVDDHHLTDSPETSGLANESLSLGHPGTRRTVYYTGDSPPPSSSLTPDKRVSDTLQQSEEDGRANPVEQSGRAEQQSEARPFLIYNKVSAVINESKNLSTTGVKDPEHDEVLVDTPSDKDPKTGSSVWYEYGCV
ncbi:girdin [Cephus cinctus]|uniref:Girdin n=1 Tax=Cephus cinctus TaxID=211228 RepID=A0AAJ7BGR5_CEPCN|nr:girdin [Cephus cinctus]